MSAAPSFATRVALGARPHAPVNQPVVLPIDQSSGWVFRSLDEVDAVYEGRAPGYIYGGSGVSNHEAFEALICSLHGSQAALATAAGMSAFAAALLHLAGSGQRVVAARDLYGNTTRLLQDFGKFGVHTDYVDASDLDAVAAALRTKACLLIVETISNPRVRVADVRALGAMARRLGALFMVDNTLATPYHCKPIELGADLVVESATKFLGGHHDIVLGALTGSQSLIDPIRRLAARAGLVCAPFEAWLALRSIATLDVRLARSSASSLAIARVLAQHPKVRAVHYPGLESGPTFASAQETLSNGFGSVLAFELDPDRKAVDRLLGALAHIKLVLTFGGVTTTLAHPATSSHRALSAQARDAIGIHDGFLRLSVGVEDPSDIIADLEGGLAAV